jgi:hypothetical protein
MRLTCVSTVLFAALALARAAQADDAPPPSASAPPAATGDAPLLPSAAGEAPPASGAPTPDASKPTTPAAASGDPETRRRALGEAYAAHATWEGARDLAEAELAAGKPADAANHLAEALAMLPKDAGALAEGDLRARLGEVKREVASIVVRANAAGVALELDGAPIGVVRQDELFAKLVYAAPGEHTVVAKYEGQEVYSDTRTIGAGERAMFDVHGKTAAGEKPLWPAFVIAGIGVAAVGTGVGLLVASLGKESDADDLAQTIPSCNLDAPSAACGELSSLIASRNDLLDGATVAFIIGGIGAVATLGYFVIPTGDDSALEEARLWLSPAPGGATLGFGGKF